MKEIKKSAKSILFLSAAAALLSTPPLWAQALGVPPSIIPELLSESVPTAFAPGEIKEEDYEIEWVGVPIPNVQLRIGKNTLQWVRVSEMLALPRARLIVEANDIQGGQVSNSGFSQPLQIVPTQPTEQNLQSTGRAEIPVALVSNEKNIMHISVSRSGQLISGEARLVFKPREKFQSPTTRIYLDPSCSPYGLNIESVKEMATSNWIYVGCRMVQVYSESHRTSSLEVFLFWDGVGDKIKIGDTDTPASSTSIWSLRLRAEPGYVAMQSEKQDILLHYHVPDDLHEAALGLGLGPYSFNFYGNNDNSSGIFPVATLYGSYYISEAFRVVGFGAIIGESHIYSDLGLYLRLEYFKFLDRRFTLNLLIGGHAVVFSSQSQLYYTASLPQGFELNFSDCFGRNRTATVGAFIYPLISGNSYYNVWVRWGGRIFGEINYISWQAMPNSIPFSSSSLGVSLGFPLIQFW